MTSPALNNKFDLANGASKTVTVTYAVASSVAPATVSNTATASAAVQPTDATDTASVYIHRSVSLPVDLPSFPTRRSSDLSGHTFTVKVTNNGPSDAVGIHLTDGVDNRL